MKFNNETIREAVNKWCKDQESALNKYGDINDWDTSEVTDMSELFSSAYEFNSPIGDWNVSKVENMSGMFSAAHSFNQPLDKWDVSKVTNMNRIFCDTNSFNQDLNNWDVSKVTDMIGMFENSQSFNQPLNNWDVSKVTDMCYMFKDTKSFNQPLDKWDVSKVIYMRDMFEESKSFNQPLNNWNINNVIDCPYEPFQKMFTINKDSKHEKKLKDESDLSITTIELGNKEDLSEINYKKIKHYSEIKIVDLLHEIIELHENEFNIEWYFGFKQKFEYSTFQCIKSNENNSTKKISSFNENYKEILRHTEYTPSEDKMRKKFDETTKVYFGELSYKICLSKITSLKFIENFMNRLKEYYNSTTESQKKDLILNDFFVESIFSYELYLSFIQDFGGTKNDYKPLLHEIPCDSNKNLILWYGCIGTDYDDDEFFIGYKSVKNKL